MIPTYINTLFLMPGAQTGYNEIKAGLPGDDVIEWLENDALGKYIYAPAREEDKRVVKIDDINIDDKGILLEPLFAVTGIQSIQTGHARHGWADYSMANGDYAELEYEIGALYDIAKRHLDNMASEEAEWLAQYHEATIDFVGLWSVVMGHGDWESGNLPEFDGFEFEGEGKVVLR